MKEKNIVDVQLQEGKVAIAVIGLVLALLGDIFLEGRGDLGVVSVEAVEDGLDVFRPVGRVVEGNHGCDVREERPLKKPSSDFVVKSQSPHFSDVEPWHFLTFAGKCCIYPKTLTLESFVAIRNMHA